MIRIFPAQRRWKIVATLWIGVSLLSLIATIVHRRDTAHAFGDAEVRELLYMMLLGFPGSMVVYLPISKFAFGPPDFPEGDVRQTLLRWSYLFFIGYIQWFVLIRFMARRVAKIFEQQ